MTFDDPSFDAYAKARQEYAQAKRELWKTTLKKYGFSDEFFKKTENNILDSALEVNEDTIQTSSGITIQVVPEVRGELKMLRGKNLGRYSLHVVTP